MGSTDGIDVRSEIRDFLSSRRARLTPEQSGLPAYGGNRRVKGLRREEVAMLAGVSVDYYVRMERGSLAGASESVLDALADALRLDEAERAHLYSLAAASGPGSTRRKRPAAVAVRAPIQQMLDAVMDAPAWVRTAAGTPSADALRLLASWAASQGWEALSVPGTAGPGTP